MLQCMYDTITCLPDGFLKVYRLFLRRSNAVKPVKPKQMKNNRDILKLQFNYHVSITTLRDIRIIEYQNL